MSNGPEPIEVKPEPMVVVVRGTGATIKIMTPGVKLEVVGG